MANYQQQISVIASSILILDIDVGPGQEVVSGVKKFKVARPHTRIILIAPGRKPGDEIIAALVGKGVYDIVSPAISEEDEEALDITKDLETVLDGKPATYSDAVRWDTVYEDENEEKDVKEKTVYLEKMVGTGHICVCGAKHGSGSTTMAIAIAEYLAAVEKKKVALMEVCCHPVLYRIDNMFHRRIDTFVQTNNFTLYQEEIKNLIEKVTRNRYDYIVMDMGAVYEPELVQEKGEQLIKKHEYYQETTRANLVVFVLGGEPWAYQDLAVYLRNDTGIHEWGIVTVGNKDLSSVIRKQTGNREIFTLPYI